MKAPRYINFIIIGVTYLALVIGQSSDIAAGTSTWGLILLWSAIETGIVAALLGFIGLISSLFIREKRWRRQAAYLLAVGVVIYLIAVAGFVVFGNDTHPWSS